MSVPVPATAIEPGRPDSETRPASARSALIAQDRGSRALKLSAAFWFGVTVVGQLLFATYIAGFYGGAVLQGRPEAWNKVMPHGYLPGSPFLNLVLGLHLLFAAAIVLAGAMQLTPQIRRRAPAFHRWLGRAYLLCAAIMSASGLTMLWVRGTVGDLPQHLVISANALLILACAGTAWVHARARRIDQHRRWALRLFLAVSGVWFFRIGLMFWIAINAGPVGFDPKTFTGPFLTFLGVFAYLAPPAILQLYFWAQDRRSRRGRYALAVTLAALSLVTIVGTVAATAIMWLPRLQS